MKKVLFTILVVAVAWCAGAAIASAQATANANLTVNVQVNAHARLTLSGGSINFGDADPGTTPTIVSTDVITITATARVGSSGNVTLTCLANTDLVSGGNSILISNITWAGAGDAGYNAAGTMSRATGQTVGTWTGPGSHVGTQTYSFNNLWSHAPGTYAATVVYTLSAT